MALALPRPVTLQALVRQHIAPISLVLRPLHGLLGEWVLRAVPKKKVSHCERLLVFYWILTLTKGRRH